MASKDDRFNIYLCTEWEEKIPFQLELLFILFHFCTISGGRKCCGGQTDRIFSTLILGALSKWYSIMTATFIVRELEIAIWNNRSIQLNSLNHELPLSEFFFSLPLLCQPYLRWNFPSWINFAQALLSFYMCWFLVERMYTKILFVIFCFIYRAYNKILWCGFHNKIH